MYNYVPGEGSILRMVSTGLSDGELVDGDTFHRPAYAKKSDMLWWLSEAQKAAKVTQPSDWSVKLPPEESGKWTIFWR